MAAAWSSCTTQAVSFLSLLLVKAQQDIPLEMACSLSKVSFWAQGRAHLGGVLA